VAAFERLKTEGNAAIVKHKQLKALKKDYNAQKTVLLKEQTELKLRMKTADKALGEHREAARQTQEYLEKRDGTESAKAKLPAVVQAEERIGAVLRALAGMREQDARAAEAEKRLAGLREAVEMWDTLAKLFSGSGVVAQLATREVDAAAVGGVFRRLLPDWVVGSGPTG